MLFGIVFGVLVNVFAVLCGGTFGLLLGQHLKDVYRSVLRVAVGLVTLVLGMRMALSSDSLVLSALSLILGGIAGTVLRIEDRLLAFGGMLRQSLARGEMAGGDNRRFARGLLDASLLFCVGPMTILGSIESALNNNNDIVFTKSLLDGFMSVILAAASGVGVLFSSVSVLVIQGGIVLGAGFLGPFLDGFMLESLSSVGGFLILMITLNILEIKQVPTANFLPSLVMVVFLVWFRGFFPF